ncbi:3-(methylthio)propionyl-CoA ligase [Variovorax defluvii]|uniref:3-(Methylthio)propionyl-CoA ligase n=1 Tax=Variovorax defluvii TaxID=913761 RepID=A0ABP8HKL1_9BURK
MLHGLMQHQPLLISNLIRFAEKHHGDAEIVSRRVEGDLHRSTWRNCAARARQVANALDAEDLSFSDRVGTLAWNGYRHLELYYGVSGSGRVLHTINPRLHPDQVAWIVNHAEDKVLCFDLSFLPLVNAIHERCASVKKWVALCSAESLPDTGGMPGLVSYEEWMGGQPSDYDWPQFDENAASSMCYTSGTTGNPKGVLYTHRSSTLHAYAISLPDAMNLSARDSVLPVVPMFHVNAWGIPFSAALVGCKLVLPGPALDGASVHSLIESEKVTFAAGVPTVWQGLLGHVEGNALGFSSLRRTMIGGAACPPAMLQIFREKYGVDAVHAWGMTEMSPLGTVCTLKNKHLSLALEQQLPLRIKQGRAIFGVDMKLTNDRGEEIRWDGRTPGNLMVRGPWVVSRYYDPEGGARSPAHQEDDGWFPTGDVATIDADGFMQITDRSKDVIKSGGEWISSIDVENVAAAHPGVAMAACIGVFHPKWDERPVLVVVRKPGAEVTREELLAFYPGKIAKWQIPDDVVVVESIPVGATGKILKSRLREQLKDYRLPELPG